MSDCARFRNGTCPMNDRCNKYYHCRIMHEDGDVMPDGVNGKDFTAEGSLNE